MKPVEVFQEELEVILPVLPDDEGVVHVLEPNLGTMVCCIDGELLEFLHEHISQNQGYKRSHGGSG